MADTEHKSATGDTLADFRELAEELAATDKATLKWDATERLSFREYCFSQEDPENDQLTEYTLRYNTHGLKSAEQTVVRLDVKRFVSAEGIKGVREVYQLNGRMVMSRTVDTVEWVPSSLELSEDELREELTRAISASLPRARRDLQAQKEMGLDGVSEAEVLALNQALTDELARPEGGWTP